MRGDDHGTFTFIYQSLQTVEDMGNISNCYWKYIWFGNIGNRPAGSGDFALQYWGTHFGVDPDAAPYYFVIEITDNKASFRIAPRDVAANYGRLGAIIAN